MNKAGCVMALAAAAAGIASASGAEAAEAKLLCTALDNVDPGSNRFQYRLRNPRSLAVRDNVGGGTPSASTNTTTIPKGAIVTVTGHRPNGPGANLNWRLVFDLSPGSGFLLPRPAPLSGSCSAIARW